MDFKEVKELIDLVNSSNLAFFEYETNDGHIKLDKSLTRDVSNSYTAKEVKSNEINGIAESANNISANAVTNPLEVEEKENEDNYIVITAPMVGTFYSSSSPDKEAFVKSGDLISVGDTLCIVEAMKLMNEIESEVNGVVKKVLVKDGDMVEYGQPLFKIEEN